MAPAKRDKIRVVLAEDQAMVLGALAALLEMEDDIEVVARAHSGDEALRLVQQLRPDVLVTDIEMPGLTGLEVAAELKRRGVLVRVIILTTFARAGYLRRALEAGASGYLLKDMPAEQLADAVRRVRSGLRVIDPQLAAEAWTNEPDPLTERERQVLRLGGRWHGQLRHRYRAELVGRHRAQLSVGSDQQAGRGQPYRSGSHRAFQRMAVARFHSRGAGLSSLHTRDQD